MGLSSFRHWGQWLKNTKIANANIIDYLRYFQDRFSDKSRPPRCWWWPLEHHRTFHSKEEWQRQHDETSSAIRLTMLTIIGFGFYCLLSLSTSDVYILIADPQIVVPYAPNIQISYTHFFLVGPVILIVLTIYLHVFIEYQRTLGAFYERSLPLPFIFNIPSLFAQWVSGFVFYWWTPLVMLALSFKVSPHPGGKMLVLATTIVTTFLVGLQIRRWPSNQRDGCLYQVLWGVGCLLVFITFYQVGHSYSLLARSLILSQADLLKADLKTQNLDRFYLGRIELKKALLPEVSLRRASLWKADLEEAKLRGAKLGDADLRGTIFVNADLQEAQLGGAKLQKAWLSGAQLQKATLAQATLTQAHLDKAVLRGANFAGARLQGADLQEADLEGADLRSADLLKAQNLTVQQLSKVFTLYKAKLDSGLEKQIKDNYSYLMKQPQYDK